MANRNVACTTRHNMLKLQLAQIAREAGMSVEVEPLIRPSQADSIDDDQKRADLRIMGLGRHLMVDVSITHPCASSFLAQAATTRLSAANTRAAAKRDKYRAISRRIGVRFIPFVLESYGAANRDVHELIKLLSACADSSAIHHTVSFSRWAKSLLSITLQKGNCRVMGL